MGRAIYTVDAFTAEPFRGNPAAVCLLDAPRDDAWMQQVAAEMNLAETAFLHPEGATGQLRLRWFTPKVEVDLCGHATLATAHVLWETGRLARDAVARFETRSGTLTATRRGEEIELDFPSMPAQRAAPPAALVDALRVEMRFVGKNPFDWLVEVASEEVVRGLAPDLARLKQLPARGVIVTSLASKAGQSAQADPSHGCDFVSRFFAPTVGVDEDPVTGSAHCCLAPFWCERLGRTALVGWQASARGGRVGVELVNDRVLLRGRAVTVLRGELATG